MASSSTSISTDRLWTLGTAVVLLLLLSIVYSACQSPPFLFDSIMRIRDNSAIRSLGPPWGWLTYDRRPVAYLSFAINFAIHGLEISGFHWTNVGIHYLGALFLFGVVRQTLRLPQMDQSLQKSSSMLACLCALIWAVHPLQTQSITYTVQRIESLMGMLFLGAFYCFIRSAQNTHASKYWKLGSVMMAYLSIATKEVAAVLPLIVLWYDRVFLVESFREIRRTRWQYYLWLCGSWLILGYLMFARWETYGEAAGNVPGMNSWTYLLTQSEVILKYLQLAFWPASQNLDYRWPAVQSFSEVWLPFLLMAVLVVLVIIGMWKAPRWSFLGGWFFVILGPTSSIVPIVDVIFEHRMYLPLASLIVMTIIGLFLLFQNFTQRETCGKMFLMLMSLCTIALANASYQRNQLYASNLTMWEDVTRKSPQNLRGFYNRALHLIKQHELEEAEKYLRHALQLKPIDKGEIARCYGTLAVVVFRQGREEEGDQYFQTALELKPNVAEIYANYGYALLLNEDYDRSKELLERALEISPDSAFANCYMGALYVREGKIRKGLNHLDRALEFNPTLADAYLNMGIAYQRLNRTPEAIAMFEKTIGYDQYSYLAFYNLGVIHHLSQPELAEIYYRQALKIAPRFSEGHNNLGVLLENSQPNEALKAYRKSVEFDPGNAQAHYNLGELLERQKQFDAAETQYLRALEINPDHQSAQAGLARVQQR